MVVCFQRFEIELNMLYDSFHFYAMYYVNYFRMNCYELFEKIHFYIMLIIFLTIKS